MLPTRFRAAICGAISASVLFGCASIVGKSDYPVVLNSQPSGATVVVINKAGKEVFKSATPATAVLPAGDGYFKGQDYVVKFTKDGYASLEVPIKRRLSNWYLFGNIMIGGLIGWFIVDPITGAMWKLDEEASASLQQMTADEQSTTPELRVLTMDEVPADLQGHLVAIR